MSKPLESSEALPEGRYRIATVAELTGVPEPTLRAWERRYGIPSPERTSTGYRLYGEEDIRLVREMRRLSEEGIAAAEAAKILLKRTSPRASRVIEPSHDAFRLATDAILEAIEKFDDVELDDHVRRLMFLGSPTEVLDRVIVPVLVGVGDRWHSGEISVAQEHLANQKLGTVMRDFVRLLPGVDASEGVLLACFADDDHELGLLGLAIRIAELGLRPIFLGARTPPSAVRSAVEAVAPKLVALSVTIAPPRQRARELVDDYAAACRGVPWIVGGGGVRPISDMVTKRGGLVPDDAPGAVERVLRTVLLRHRGTHHAKRQP